MRSLILLPIFLVAACSDGGGAPQEAKAAADTTMEAGQWETTTEVTRLTTLDGGAPAIDTPAGTKASFTSCIVEADRRKPAPTLFAGEEAECEYNDFYMSRGRMNASMTCEVPGLAGGLVTSVEGSNDATSFEGTVSSSTRLPGSGDVRMASKISGRKIGPCPAAA